MKLIKNYYKNLNIMIKATLWFTISSTIQKCINFIAMPIFTRIMSVEDYGIYTLYVSWINIFYIFTSLRLDGSTFNKSMSKYEEDRNGYIASIQLLTSLITLLIFIFFFIFNFIFYKLTDFNFKIMIIMFVQLFFMPAYNFWILKNRYEYKYIKFSITTILLSFFNIFLGVFAVLISKKNLGEVRVFSYALCQIFFTSLLYMINFKNGIKKIKKEYIIYALKFNFPLLPHYLSQYILDQLDKIMIQKIISISKAAIYNACYSISFIIKVFSDSLIAAITPWYYDKLKKHEYKKISEIFLPIFITFIILITLFILLSPELIKIVLPKKYYEGLYTIPPIAMSIIFLMMYNYFGLLEFYFEETKFSVIVSCGGAIINFILNFIFINKIGYVAAAYTTLLCYIIFALSHYYYSKSITLKRINIAIFKDKYIFIITAVCLFITFMSNFLYKIIYIRYMIIFLLFVFILVKRKMIEKIINNLKNINESSKKRF